MAQKGDFAGTGNFASPSKGDELLANLSSHSRLLLAQRRISAGCLWEALQNNFGPCQGYYYAAKP